MYICPSLTFFIATWLKQTEDSKQLNYGQKTNDYLNICHYHDREFRFYMGSSG
jgi:hypothetical protein